MIPRIRGKKTHNAFLGLWMPIIAAAVALSELPEENNVRCLKETLAELNDPTGSLSSWQFNKSSSGYTCYFMGVQCWHNYEDRVLALRLSGLTLDGPFPRALGYCRSMTALDLSNNAFMGTIPKDLCNWLPFLVSLDLSMNNFSGHIPADLRGCRYLNDLNLAGNQLSGFIPWQLSALTRLTYLNLAGNLLTGQIPPKLSHFGSSAFEFNKDLCGKPLPAKCPTKSCSNWPAIIGAAASVALPVLVLAFAIWFWFSAGRRAGEFLQDDDRWAERIRCSEPIKVTMFERPIVRMSFSDLISATDGFSPMNIIASGRTGTLYAATLTDGSLLAVNRLPSANRTIGDRLFISEMNSLGRIRHENLVPLLGYCVAESEKLLVYKHMPNGSVWEWLHCAQNGTGMGWELRVRVAVSASAALAWLHHRCDPPVIHRYLNSRCILLDDDFCTRITDYGLSRVLSSVDIPQGTFSRADCWDFGYEAPEYARSAEPTTQADVYSFGVVLLELVSGKMAMNVEDVEFGCKAHLVNWVLRRLRTQRLECVIDTALEGSVNREDCLQILTVACACVQSRPEKRPPMRDVYRMLGNVGRRYDLSEEDLEDGVLLGSESHRLLC